MSSSVDDVDDDYDALESDQSDVGTRAARYEHNFINKYFVTSFAGRKNCNSCYVFYFCEFPVLMTPGSTIVPLGTTS